jgi:hypothetical protein
MNGKRTLRNPLFCALALAATTIFWGCSDDDSAHNNNIVGPDGGIDGALDGAAVDGAATDGHTDGALQPDGADFDGSAADADTPDAQTDPDGAVTSDWTIQTNNIMLEMTPAAIDAHPTDPNQIAVCPSSDEFMADFSVYHSTNGTVFTQTIITTFNGGMGFYGTPLGVYFDPADGQNVVAAFEPMPPDSFDDAVVHAWSTNGGSYYDRSFGSFTNPWPPDGLKFIDGAPSEVVWRSSNGFFFSTSLGEYNDRVEELYPTPNACDTISGYDVRTDDHDTVGIWCHSGTAHICNLIDDTCTDLVIAGDPEVTFLTFAPSNPDEIYLIVTDQNTGAIHVSHDGGSTVTWSADLDMQMIRVNPSNAQQACALSWQSPELHCTADGGTTWTNLSPPNLDPPYATLVRTFTWAADGAIWAVAHPGVIRHPPL